MDTARMETFSDALIAIVMTILVLGLVTPQTTDLEALLQLKAQFLAYGLSFFILAIYWINHHHLLQIAERINGRVLWANVLSLFCITLFPFATGWFGKNVNSLVPAMLYGTIFWATTVTFGLLQYSLVQCNGEGSRIYKALAGDRKPLISGGLGFVFIFLAFVIPILTPIADLVISAMWFIPPKSIERTLSRL